MAEAKRDIGSSDIIARGMVMHSGTDPRMLELLVCPLTGGGLRYDASTQELVSVKARLVYPIRQGIPVMLISEARPLSEEEL